MFQLIYTSTERREFSPADLRKLLMHSRMLNSQVGVTGMLVYHAGTFLQALEGDEAAVRDTFARIEHDPRHRDLHLLHCAPSLGRRPVFGEWSMGFADASGAAHILRGFVDLNRTPDLSTLDKAEAMDVLRLCSHGQAQKTA